MLKIVDRKKNETAIDSRSISFFSTLFYIILYVLFHFLFLICKVYLLLTKMLTSASKTNLTSGSLSNEMQVDLK